MKRILAVILVIAMVLSLAACGGNEEKAEKYCSSCGVGISKEATFCPDCGAEVGGTKSESEDTSSENSTPSENTDMKGEETSTPSNNTPTTSTPSTSTPSTSAPSATTPSTSTPSTNTPSTNTPSTNTPSTNTPSTSTPTTPTHTHSYSPKVTAATCKSRGYTTYTCSCGDSYISDYKNTVSHSYSKYVCTMCGAVDKSHSYEYLMEWVKANGTKDSNNNITYIYEGKNNSSDQYGLTYHTADNYLDVWHYQAVTNEASAYTSLSLDIYYYWFSFYGDKLYGYISASTYNDSSTLTYKGSSCSKYTPQKLLPTAKTSIDVVLSSLKWFLTSNNFPITLSDLGFKAY